MFFFKLIIINSSTLDLFFRLNINDSFINFYSFFWTNFWYLPIFYFFIFLFFYFLFNYYYYFIYLVPLIFITIIYSFDVFDYFLSNLQFNFFDVNSTSFNSFLFNNINKYHPFIFYLSTILMTFSLILFIYTLINDHFFYKKENSLIKVNVYVFFIFSINLFSLFLGSWWAIQEGSWGGWWNWDASETLGLLITIFAISIIHANKHYFLWINYLYQIQLIFIFIIFVYYFIQLNFDLVSHNFGIKFFFFFNNNLFLLECIYLFFYLFFYLKLKHILFFYKFYFIFKNKIIFKSWLSIKYGLVFFLLIILFKALIVSFNFLFNYFLWNFLYLNTINYELDMMIISVSFSLIFLLLFTKISLKLLIVAILFNHFYLIIFYYNLLTSFSFFHFSTVNFFLTSFFSINSPLLMPLYAYNGLVFFINTLIYPLNPTYTINYSFIEKTFSFFISTNKNSSWSLDNILNFFNHPLFLFNLNFNNFYNLIILNLDLNSSNIYLESINSQNLLFFYPSMLIFFYFYKNKFISLYEFKHAFSAIIQLNKI